VRGATLAGGCDAKVKEGDEAANQHRWLPQIKVVGCFLLVGGLVMWGLMSLGWERKAAKWVAGPVGFAAAGALMGFVTVRTAAKRAVVRCFEAEVCPACGYSLRGLSAEGDGARVCSECGGAWRWDEGVQTWRLR
jgi:hypothetical protein